MANISHTPNSQGKQQQQSEENKKDSLFGYSIPIRMANTIDDKLYVEYMMDSYAKVNKLAFLGEARSKDFNPDYIVSPNSYAEVGNNYNANPDANPKLSNEKVKVELTREFYQNPSV